MIVPDWDLKKEAIRIVLGLERPNDIINEVVDEKFLQECGVKYENLEDHFVTRWSRKGNPISNNSKYKKFFYELSFMLKCQEAVYGSTMAYGTIAEFIKCLPEEPSRKSLIRAVEEKHSVTAKYLERLKQALEQAGCLKKVHQSSVKLNDDAPTNENEVIDRYFPVWTGITTNPLRLVSDGLKSKNIDQSFYYQYPESAARWFSITNNGRYKGFDKCKWSLQLLTWKQEWMRFIQQPNFEGVVMLGGGGSPSKDTIILKSLVNDLEFNASRKDPVKHTLVDTSYYMLVTSHQAIEREIRNWTERANMKVYSMVDIRSMVSDMNKLHQHKAFLRGDGPVAWFITGGTIGNVDEAQFFSSVASQAKPGDWLVVGAHMVEDREGFLEDLEQEYRQEEVQQLVKMPLRGVLAELDIQEPSKMASEIQIKALPEEMNNHSAVPGSVSVEATIEIDGVSEVLLFKSSRYREEELARLASKYNWSHLMSVDGPDHTFKQVVFRFEELN